MFVPLPVPYPSKLIVRSSTTFDSTVLGHDIVDKPPPVHLCLLVRLVRAAVVGIPGPRQPFF